MEVFIVPAGADRHELYCEVADETPAADAPAPAGLRARLSHRFRDLLAAAERHRHRPSPEPSTGWTGRVGRWVMRHIAETITEQRLLWQLRHREAVRLHYPADLTEEAARALLHGALARDRRRHRFWMASDGLIAAITGPLFFFVPGPNLVAYYFVFRFVGHYLAWRGARHGEEVVTWTTSASAPLADLRAALRLPAVDRDQHIHEIAERLRLSHLPSFVRRTAV
jgi:hypothetical protein